MKKILLLTSLFILIALSVFIISNSSIRNYFKEQLDVVEFEGTITSNYTNGAIADASGYIVVNGYNIIITRGFGPPASGPRGVYDIKSNDIGKKVKVRAKKVDEKTLTIYGDSSYYVKLAE